MNTETIIAILGTQAETYQGMLNVLEDGQALKELGITDADQEQVEEAHYLLSNKFERELEKC